MPQPVIVGGLYAQHETDGSYSVIKVLVVDEHTVHIRRYANSFRELPRHVGSAELSLGILESGGFGIGHLPMAREGFETAAAVLVGREEVAEEELDGYRIWAGIDPV